MCGDHCLKAWSKTQAIVAKSSGEAELYAVVRGATEALGMATLAGDLGRKVEIQLHIDALAAKGMIERKGLSRVRHLDVNVLWLQEQAARKILPVYKVPGEHNPADLMTKHLAAAGVKKNVALLKMTFVDGRAGKAAQLHSVDKGLRLWDAVRDRFADQQGGDRWKHSGAAGIWQRAHLKPRRALFTPYKVPRGPCSPVSLSHIRFTKGVSQSGIEFEFHDDWTAARNSHRLLDEPWVGCSIFVEKGCASLSDVQSRIASCQSTPKLGIEAVTAAAPGGPAAAASGVLRWSEVFDSVDCQ